MHPDRLEVKLAAQLHHSTVALRAYRRNALDTPKVWVADVTVRLSEVRVVEGVEGLKPHLEVHRLRKVDVLLQSHVPVIKARAVEWVAIGVTSRSGIGNGESRRV